MKITKIPQPPKEPTGLLWSELKAGDAAKSSNIKFDHAAIFVKLSDNGGVRLDNHIYYTLAQMENLFISKWTRVDAELVVKEREV